MQSRKHPITSRFSCHIVIASIFFAFYCSNRVRYTGNHTLHNDYISLNQAAIAGATAAVFCAFEPALCSSILATFMDFCWLFSMGGELTTAKNLHYLTYYTLTSQVFSIFLHILACFYDTVLHLRSFLQLYFPRR